MKKARPRKGDGIAMATELDVCVLEVGEITRCCRVAHASVRTKEACGLDFRIGNYAVCSPAMLRWR
jgi:hypothetical protein